MKITIEKWGEKEAERQKWRGEGEKEVIMFTDGSNREGKGGVGICRVGRNGRMKVEECFGTGSRMEIMDIEIMGIKKGVERGIQECREEGANVLTIRLDSQQAMRRCQERSNAVGEHMAHQIRQLWEMARRRGISVELEWIKGHSKMRETRERMRWRRREERKAWTRMLSYRSAGSKQSQEERQ